MYRKQIEEFRKYLNCDWKQWATLQVKNCLLSGTPTLKIAVLNKGTYKKAKTFCNFWKPVKEKYYYDPLTNIIVTDHFFQDLIDFFGNELRLRWFISMECDESINFSRQYVLCVRVL